jgi:hypothetical protein
MKVVRFDVAEDERKSGAETPKSHSVTRGCELSRTLAAGIGEAKRDRN